MAETQRFLLPPRLTLVEDIRSFTAARTATSVHLTASLFPNTSQTFALHATVVGVSNPPSKLIYRVNGAFLASATQNSPNPILFTPQFQGSYTLSAEYPGDAVLAPSTGTTTLVVGNPNGDFSLGASPASATIKAGQSATFTITISPVNGMNSPVTFRMQRPAGSIGLYFLTCQRHSQWFAGFHHSHRQHDCRKFSCYSNCRPASLELYVVVAWNRVWIFRSGNRRPRQKCQTLLGCFRRHRTGSSGCELRRRRRPANEPARTARRRALQASP